MFVLEERDVGLIEKLNDESLKIARDVYGDPEKNRSRSQGGI